MNNIGRIIYDHYCNGFGDTAEDLSGSSVEAEGKDWIILRTVTLKPIFINFTKHLNKKQELIDMWCMLQQQQA